MKAYQTPYISILELDVMDILTLSNGGAGDPMNLDLNNLPT